MLLWSYRVQGGSPGGALGVAVVIGADDHVQLITQACLSALSARGGSPGPERNMPVVIGLPI